MSVRNAAKERQSVSAQSSTAEESDVSFVIATTSDVVPGVKDLYMHRMGIRSRQRAART